MVTEVVEFNILGVKFKFVNVKGPATYAQTTGQVLTMGALKMKNLYGVICAGHMVVASTGAEVYGVMPFIQGNMIKNGLQKSVEVHFTGIGGSEVANGINLSSNTYVLLLIGQ